MAWYLEELAWAYGINLGGMFPNSYGTNNAFHGFTEGVVSERASERETDR